MKKIMVVEDDTALCSGICIALQSEENSFFPCGTMQEARKRFASDRYDLIILDINLPDGNGMEFLKEIRAGSSVPVILLTANDMETDIVSGLESGADDYVTKPFSLAVLRARVHTQLRRQDTQTKETVRIGPFTFYFSDMKFYKGSMELELSKTEQKLLKILVYNQPGCPLLRIVKNDWYDRKTDSAHDTHTGVSAVGGRDTARTLCGKSDRYAADARADVRTEYETCGCCYKPVVFCDCVRLFFFYGVTVLCKTRAQGGKSLSDRGGAAYGCGIGSKNTQNKSTPYKNGASIFDGKGKSRQKQEKNSDGCSVHNVGGRVVSDDFYDCGRF